MMWRAALAGVVVGGLVTAALVVTDWEPRTVSHRAGVDVRAHRRAAQAFVGAWERSLRSSWYVAFEFTRRLSDGRELRGPGTAAQRPPDRLITQFGAVSGRVDGRAVECSPAPAASESPKLTCIDAGAAPPYAIEVERDVRQITAYVGGPLPLYLVERESDACFVLTRTVAVLSPPYGDRARFCFDRRTGALTDTRVESPASTDTRRAITVRSDVFDSDLVVPAGGG